MAKQKLKKKIANLFKKINTEEVLKRLAILNKTYKT